MDISEKLNIEIKGQENLITFVAGFTAKITKAHFFTHHVILSFLFNSLIISHLYFVSSHLREESGGSGRFEHRRSREFLLGPLCLYTGNRFQHVLSTDRKEIFLGFYMLLSI